MAFTDRVFWGASRHGAFVHGAPDENHHARSGGDAGQTDALCKVGSTGSIHFASFGKRGIMRC